MSVRTFCTSENPSDNIEKQMKIKKNKRNFIILYWVNFLLIASLFFTSYVPGYKFDSYAAPKVVVLWYDILSYKYLGPYCFSDSS